MFRRILAGQRRTITSAAHRNSFGLQIVLWLLWSLAVIAVGYLAWHADIAAHRPINTLGLVIHCAVAGVIGLVVMTWLEMRIEPWHFME
jgi:hypothetical protein